MSSLNNNQNHYLDIFINNASINNYKSIAISPQFNWVCVVSNQRDASVFRLPCLKEINALWQCGSKVQCCFFSEDGKKLLVILSVNSFQIYNIVDEEIKLSVQVKASSLATLLQKYRIDFSAACKVVPLKLLSSELILMIDNRLIICLKWKFNDPVFIKYAIEVTANCSLTFNNDFLFILSENIISVYNLLTGVASNQEICLKSSIQQASTHQSYLYTKLCASFYSNSILVSTDCQKCVLYDTTEFFNITTSKSLAPGSKKERWPWVVKSKRTSAAEDVVAPYTIVQTILPPDGLVVSYIQSTLKGFVISYTILGDGSPVVLKFYDHMNGDLLFSCSNISGVKILPMVLPLLCLDRDKSLCFMLGSMSDDEFVIKLCEIFPNFEVSSEFKKSLSKCKNLSSYHLSFVKIILTLHMQMFKEDLKCFKSQEDSVPSVQHIIETSDLLFNAVYDISREITNQEVEYDTLTTIDIISAVYKHCVSLLDEAYVEIHNMMESDVSGNICNCLLNHVSRLYQLVKHNDPLSKEWITWRNMSNDEIIQEAVVVGAVALSHVYLVTERNQKLDDICQYFKTIAESWVIELVSSGDLEHAKLALTNMGYCPFTHLKQICMTTNESLMRDVLATYLSENNQLADDEISAWQFIQKIESALSSFTKMYKSYEHEMKVTSQEKIHCIMYKLLPFHGSIDLNMLLRFSDDWKDMVLVEVYFNTADNVLEKSLKPTIVWKYLLEVNQIDLLITWINLQYNPNNTEIINSNVDFITKIFYNWFSNWPITEEMLELINNIDTMLTTKNSVLDHLATFGIFPKSNLNCLQTIVNSCSELGNIRKTLNLPSSRLSPDDFDSFVLEKCIDLNLNYVAINLLKHSNVFNIYANYIRKGGKSVLWLDVWKIFRNWEKNRDDKTLIQSAIKMSSVLYPVDESLNIMMELADILLSNKELSTVISEELIGEKLLTIPLIEISCFKLQGANKQEADITLYDLLSNSNLPTDKLFLWQNQNKIVKQTPDMMNELPHFNHPILSDKYGYRQSLDYIYYLKQSRPCFACNLFLVETLRTRRRLTSKMIKRSCNLAHGLSLRHWKDPTVGITCVSFMVMLGDISGANTLRIHLAVVALIMKYLPDEQKHYVGTLVHGIITKDSELLEEILNLVEDFSMKEISTLTDPIDKLKKWSLAVSFAYTHKLALPTLLPKYFADRHLWFPFLLCLDVFKYSYEQVIQLVEDIDCKILKSHLIRAFTRTTLKLSTTSPSKSPPKILLEPDTTADYTENSRDPFKNFVTNIYTEVLNTIQTFTDRNIVLPWSCEQNPDEDLLLTLLKAESEPETCRILLIAAVELQSPVLAVLATCFQCDDVTANLRAWLISAIPTSLPRVKRREEGQLLIEEHKSMSEVGCLIVQFFHTGYIQTLYRGLAIFMNDNPITTLVEGVYQCIILFDFTLGQSTLKSFATMLDGQRVKDSFPSSKMWMLKISSELIEAILTRPDLANNVKKQFLKVVVDAGLDNFAMCLPTYSLWYQLCTILETTTVNINFAQLCKQQDDPDELQRCLDELVDNGYFKQAVATCCLLNLNQDQIIVAEWSVKFDQANKMNNVNFKWWLDCSQAFDGQVYEASCAANFFQQRVAVFDCCDADSVNNKYYACRYCLEFRKKYEDETLTTCFKEESDSIELEMWKCCIDSRFDRSILIDYISVNKEPALLVNVWYSSKVFAKSQLLTDAEKQMLHSLCDLVLDQGDLHTTLRVASFFNYQHQDLTTITNGLKLCQGLMALADVSRYSSLLLGTRTRKLESVRGMSPILFDFEVLDVSPKEQQETLSLLDNLVDRVSHGSCIARKIFVCFRLSVNLNLEFKVMCGETDYLYVLTRSLQGQCCNKFQVASDLLVLADMSDEQTAKFLKDNIVSSIEQHHSSGLVTPLTLWGVNLETDFHLVSGLMKNSALLGLELVEASVIVSPVQGVELLIKAHDCYTAVCNVEGIGLVLRRARILSSQLLQAQQWRYLVRLATGIGRYDEMSYVFQMLKDNDQFEYLLKKGMDKVPGLDLAICDFLQRYCSQDRELRKMVTSHFHLYNQEAMLWLSDAEDVTTRLLSTGDQLIKDNSKNRQALQLAMENYSHAAEYFLQGGKMQRALAVSYQAQLVALQLSVLGSHTILGLNSSTQVHQLVSNHLSVAQSLLLSRAYDVELDWSAIVHERWIVKGDKTFFNDMKSCNLLTHFVLQSYSARFEADDRNNNKYKERIKQLLQPQLQMNPYLKDLNHL